MRAVVFAYHNLGVIGLEALARHGYEIAAVLSHDDDPAENRWFDSVTDWAGSHSLPLYTPSTLKGPWVERVADWRPDVLFSFYYRLMIPPAILAIPPAGAYNLHGSLLPAYAGRCPVNWVLVNGETETGLTLHRMVEKPDAGDLVGQRTVSIAFTDTAHDLYRKLCAQAVPLLDELLPLIREGRAPRIPQDFSRRSYFGGRRPEDGRISWDWPAPRIYNLIRAVTEPYPGAFGFFPDGTKLLLWWALPEPAPAALKPGTLHNDADAVYIQAGEGRLRLLDVEISGSRIREAAIREAFKDKEGRTLI